MGVKLKVEFLNPLVVLHQPVPSVFYRAIFTFQLGQLVFRGENMVNTMQAGSTANLGIQWVDEFGNPAKVDGLTSWASTDSTLLTLQVSPDSMSAQCVSVGPIGPVQVQATADADMGTGVQTITATCDINIIAGEASGGTITFTPATSASMKLVDKVDKK